MTAGHETKFITKESTIMAPHQQRVVDEYNELFEKTTKLGVFFGSPIFAKLGVREQALLNRQWRAMQEYGLILSERIAAFE